MKFRKKPTTIEAIEFGPSSLPPGIRATMVREKDGEWQVWNELHRSWINVKLGDMVNITKYEDVYPIERATFDATYEPA